MSQGFTAYLMGLRRASGMCICSTYICYFLAYLMDSIPIHSFLLFDTVPQGRDFHPPMFLVRGVPQGYQFGSLKFFDSLHTSGMCARSTYVLLFYTVHQGHDTILNCTSETCIWSIRFRISHFWFMLMSEMCVHHTWPIYLWSAHASDLICRAPRVREERRVKQDRLVLQDLLDLKDHLEMTALREIL